MAWMRFPEGAVALVTGASRGIGLATAELLTRSGVHTALASRQREVCERHADRLTAEHGTDCSGFGCDVRDPKEVATTVRAIRERFGRLDIVVNNAGVLADARIGMASQAMLAEVFETNALGAIHVMQATSRLLVRSPAGAVVNVSSVTGADGNVGQAIYASSKAALVGLTRSAARELGPSGVRVNAVSPGLIDTAMTADLPGPAREALEARILLRRAGTPEDVASVIGFLASECAKYITGQVIRVDGGLII